MKNLNLERGRAPMLSSQILTREEHEALMSELARGLLPESPPLFNLHERLKRLEFNLMILVGLILAVLMLCHGS